MSVCVGVCILTITGLLVPGVAVLLFCLCLGSHTRLVAAQGVPLPLTLTAVH